MVHTSIDMALPSLTHPDDWIADPVAVSALDKAVAVRHSVLPIGFNAATGHLHLAMTRPEDSLRRRELDAVVNPRHTLRWHRATDDVVREGLQRCYGASADAFASPQTEVTSGDADEDQRAVRLVDELLHGAVAWRASDLHVLPGPRVTRVRTRVDGHLRDFREVDGSDTSAVINRIKVMSSLDVAETRRPQDGRMQRLVSARPVDMRVSTFPLLHQESVVVRLHDKACAPGSLSALGLDAATLADIHAVLDGPPGLVISCGPTGSGKTTTLYALLKSMDDGTRSLMTLEDPVEHALEGVAQASVDPSRAIDFASGIRALLRQDPDVLLVGEIRDAESCRMAVRAALSGMRVLATLHADSSSLAVTRLVELGADPNELASTLVAVLAQRLLRRRDQAGRSLLLEILRVCPEIRTAIKRAADADTIARLAFSHRPRLEQLAWDAVRSGDIDRADVVRTFGHQTLHLNKEAQGCAYPTTDT